MRCRICSNHSIDHLFSFGSMPPANNFLKESELSCEEMSFPLDLFFCTRCTALQLGYTVSPDLLFKNYVYVSSTSNTFKAHFSKMAKDIAGRFGLSKGSFVVDIGSNDGLLLSYFGSLGVETMGVEPAANLCEVAKKQGVDAINAFFGKPAVEQIIQKKGKADVITANNVFAHIVGIHDVIEQVKALLKENGAFIVEVAYLHDMFERMAFDTVYHEHLFYYSLTSLQYLFSLHSMEIFDVQHVDSHGGSIRVFAKRKEDALPLIQPSVKDMLDAEKGRGYHALSTYQGFASRIAGVREKLLLLLRSLKKNGKKIAIFGAPAKGNTLLNFCGIDKTYVEYIVDENPLKIGLYSPGMHLPVVGTCKLEEDQPDVMLILAWNFSEEILQKTRPHAQRGMKFIIPLPEPIVV